MRSRAARPAIPRSAAAAAVALLVATACAAPSPTPPPTPVAMPSAAATTTPSAAASPTAAISTVPSASPSPSVAVAPGDPAAVVLGVEPFLDGLDRPVFATGAGDGSGRLFVVEQPGRIRVVRDGRLLERPFLDISDQVSCCGERGLLGLAFAPGDATRFFVDYTDRDGNTVVSGFQVGEDGDAADAATERIVLEIAQPYANHNGGMIAFGPDGYLYVGMGDGGSGGDPEGNGQDLAARLGKLLRIDVTGRVDEPYAIPADNPYVGVADAAAEIWASGLRNPWRFSFDRVTGDLWVGDVGQRAREEIDRARAADGRGRGANFGWNVMEGTGCYGAGDCDRTGLVLPVAEYGHDLGCAVTGGYVYRGSAQPALAGIYLFADYCSGRIWGLASGGPDSQAPVELAKGIGNIVSFAEDDAGELYAVDLGGRVLRIVARPA